MILEDLRQKKVENIAIVCPSFVSDCLETLEEINIRARSQWLELGGRDFVFIPCLNTHVTWVNGLVELIKSQMIE
ncbi:MAG: ferrochelatase [Legionellales bacterium]|nr:ferrochelatase [Legionellales bacterium]